MTTLLGGAHRTGRHKLGRERDCRRSEGRVVDEQMEGWWIAWRVRLQAATEEQDGRRTRTGALATRRALDERQPLRELLLPR